MSSPGQLWPVQPIWNASQVPLSQQPGTLPNMADTIMNLFQLLTVDRITKTIDPTFEVLETTTSQNFQGVLQPFTARQLYMKSVGQRLWKWYTVHTLPSIQLLPDDVVLDQQGVQYRIMEKLAFAQYGYDEYHAIQDYTGAGPVPFVPTPVPPMFSQYSVQLDPNSGQYVDVGQALNPVLVIGSPFSISAWIYLTSVDGSNTILGDLDGSGNGFVFSAATGTPSMYFASTLGLSPYWQVIGDAPVPLNTWTHLVMTYPGDPLADTVLFYLNGVALTSIVITDTLLDSVVSVSDMTLGTVLSQGSGDFTGNLDEVSVFTSVLSPDTILQIYNNGIPSNISLIPTLSAWWRFQQNFQDAVGTAPGTGVGTPVFTGNVPT